MEKKADADKYKVEIDAAADLEQRKRVAAGVAAMSGGVPIAIKQAFDVLKSATGVDMADIMRAGTIDAKVNRNINLNDEAREAVDNMTKG